MTNKFWSNNPWDWGIIPLSCLVPNWKDMFEERKKAMTDEQGRKLYKMDDQRLLCELAIAYGNTIDANLGCCHRKNIIAVFADLNLDHMNDYPCDAKEGSGS